MKKYQNILYINDNGFQFYSEKNQQIYQQKLLKKIVKQGKIIHCPKFIKELLSFIKINKISSRFQYDELTMITPPNFYEIDKEIFKIIKEELPFNGITFIKETSLYQMKKNEVWLNIQDTYFNITSCDKNLRKESKTMTFDFWGLSLEFLINQFIKTNSKIKKIIILGSNSAIPKITKKLETKHKIKVYYFENYQNYLIELTKKHNLT